MHSMHTRRYDAQRGLSRVGYDRYLRFVMPYFGIALVICIAFMFLGAAFG